MMKVDIYEQMALKKTNCKIKISQTQVCIGAVQRPLLADVHARHARPPVLPARPPGCADPDVQRHPQHALAT